MVVIAWKLDLQLPVQSVSITTKVVSSNPDHGEVYSIQDHVMRFVRSWFSSGTPISSINKTDRHDITGMLLKVALYYVKYILIIWCMYIANYT